MTDRHARWNIWNVFDAKDADLVCAHGTKVRAGIDNSGWYVQTDSQRLKTIDAVETAAALNHFGVLPRAEHEAIVMEHA